MTRTRIKICGIATVEAARAAVDAGADAIGLVAAPGSPRFLQPDAMREIADSVRESVITVGVYRDPDPATLEDLVGAWIQLHGDEDETLAAAIDRPVIKGFSFVPEAVRRWDRCPHVHALLVDGPAAGSGIAFDHAALATLEITKPLILAGGLTPDNVAEAIRVARPWAVDVSSGVESAPGVKDPALIERFCAAVRGN